MHFWPNTDRQNISTPLLLEGLEFDHVLISGAALFLTISGKTPHLHFPLPNLRGGSEPCQRPSSQGIIGVRRRVSSL